MIPQPLTARRVIDLSQYIAGPSCAQLLADFGAEVIKVEPPAGDPSRSLGTSRHGSEYYRQFNTGKSSLTIDLQTASGKQQLHELLAGADGLVMNFSARARHKLGLTWEELHETFPDLSVVSISAYGDGDQRTALDSVMQAESGFAMINADESGNPTISDGYPTDIFTGLYAGISLAMALLDTELKGGTFIDVPMIEVAMSSLLGPAILSLAGGDSPLASLGNRDTATAPSTIFTAADGSVYIYAGLDKHWELLQGVVNGPEGTAAERLAHPGLYEEAVNAWTRTRTVAHILEELHPLGIAAAPITSPVEALTRLHEQRPDAVVAEHAGEPTPQFPATFSGRRIKRSSAPRKESMS